MKPAALAVLISLSLPAFAAAQSASEESLPFSVGVNGFVYVERSEPGLDGETNGVAASFTARLQRRASLLVEAGRAKFYEDDQPGHRDFFLSGLVGVRPLENGRGLVLVAGPTLIHSERHKFFGDLATNRVGLTLGADWEFLIGERVAVAINWRTDLGSGITVHRPGGSLRLRF